MKDVKGFLFTITRMRQKHYFVQYTRKMESVTESVIDVKNAKCAQCTHEGCKSQSIYNYEGKMKASYCSVHKQDGMVDVKSRKCAHEGCKTIPIFNYENQTM